MLLLKVFDADQFIEPRTSYPEQTRAINIPPNIPIARRDPGFPWAGVSLFARERVHTEDANCQIDRIT